MAITINSVGGDPDGSALANYQFVLVSGSTTNYNFCTSNGTVVTTSPTSFTNGEEFEFNLAVGGVTYTWKIKDYNLTSNPLVGGKWHNNHKKPQITDTDDDEKGTFTLQSGIDEDVKGKPAKAY